MTKKSIITDGTDNRKNLQSASAELLIAIIAAVLAIYLYVFMHKMGMTEINIAFTILQYNIAIYLFFFHTDKDTLFHLAH